MSKIRKFMAMALQTGRTQHKGEERLFRVGPACHLSCPISNDKNLTNLRGFCYHLSITIPIGGT